MYHPATGSHGGTSIIMKNSIKHHQPNNHCQHFLQSTSVLAEDLVGLLSILAVNLPPRTIQRFDYSPALIILTAHELNQEQQPNLSNTHTNLDEFRHLTERLTSNVSHKTEEDIEATVKFFNDAIQ
jgi:hypothetical protein